MKVNRQPRAQSDLSTLGTMLRPKPPARLEEVDEEIDELMATLAPFQRQILVHKLMRKYQQ